MVPLGLSPAAMEDSGDEDLADIAISNVAVPTYAVTRVDVDKEIRESKARRERQNEMKAVCQQEAECDNQQNLDVLQIRPLPQPEICSLPPDRKIFQQDRSQKSFNSASLTTENIFPSNGSTCSLDNVDEFFYWIRSKLKAASVDQKRRLFQYLWLLMSCHPKPHVVQKSCDTLVDFNSSWRLSYEEVILVFYNWGVSPSDFSSNMPLENIVASLNTSPVVSAFNVENTLRILNYQLTDNNLGATDESAKSIFVLLLLLALDTEYRQCLSEIYSCLEHLTVYAKSINSKWIEDYCQALFAIGLHHAQLAFLIECVVPEQMRWCLCLAFCQHIFSEEICFEADPQTNILHDILHNHFEEFMKLGSWELYSVLSVVSAGISHSITFETDPEIKRGFLHWLNHYMERRPERKKDDIDVDAILIAELVSRLQAEWEAMWPGMHAENVDEIQSEESEEMEDDE